jgi:hypothetical protein
MKQNKAHEMISNGETDNLKIILIEFQWTEQLSRRSTRKRRDEQHSKPVRPVAFKTLHPPGQAFFPSML